MKEHHDNKTETQNHNDYLLLYIEAEILALRLLDYRKCNILVTTQALVLCYTLTREFFIKIPVLQTNNAINTTNDYQKRCQHNLYKDEAQLYKCIFMI